MGLSILVRPCFAIAFCFLSLSILGQINDADAYFNGTYDKGIVRKHSIKQIDVTMHIDSNKTTSYLLDFDKQGFLTQQTVFNKASKKVNEYTFTYNTQGDQIERRQTAHEMNKTYTVTWNKTYNGSQLVQETSSEFPFLTIHIYDGKQKKVQSNIFPSGDTAIGPKRVFFYNYNTNGKLKNIQETYTESNHSPTVGTGKSEYVYDESGNISVLIRVGKANYYLSYNKDGLLQSKTVKMPEDLGGLTIVEIYSYIFWK